MNRSGPAQRPTRHRDETLHERSEQDEPEGSIQESRDTALIGRKGTSAVERMASSSQILFSAKTDACASPPHHSTAATARDSLLLCAVCETARSTSS